MIDGYFQGNSYERKSDIYGPDGSITHLKNADDDSIRIKQKRVVDIYEGIDVEVAHTDGRLDSVVSINAVRFDHDNNNAYS